MTMSDTIGDMLTRIRNAYAAKRNIVKVPFSKVKFAIVNVLHREGYIKCFSEKEDENKKIIEIELKYFKDGEKAIREIKRISKPSRRIYVACDEIKTYKGGLGISIISTSKGVISDRLAKQKGVGGELICTVW